MNSASRLVENGMIATVIRAVEMIELRLLPDPEDAQGQDAHREGEDSRRERDQRAPACEAVVLITSHWSPGR